MRLDLYCKYRTFMGWKQPKDPVKLKHEIPCKATSLDECCSIRKGEIPLYNLRQDRTRSNGYSKGNKSIHAFRSSKTLWTNAKARTMYFGICLLARFLSQPKLRIFDAAYCTPIWIDQHSGDFGTGDLSRCWIARESLILVSLPRP